MGNIKRAQVCVNSRGEIPAAEHWLFQNLEAFEGVRRGLKDAAESRTSKLDVQEL